VPTDAARTVFASFVAIPGKEEELAELLRWMADQSRKEPGCRQFDLYRAEPDGGLSYHFIEHFNNAAAIDAHRATSHYKEYRSRVADLIEGGVGVVVLAPIDVST
jgi:quinol monooxygenase YgiN